MKTTAENALTAKLFKNGDSKVFQMCYLSLLYKFLPMTKGNKPLAQDLAMEVLEKAMENIKSYNPKYALSTWLHVIAKNYFLDHLKTRKMENKFTIAFTKLESERGNSEYDEPTVDFGSSDKTPEDILISKEKTAQIMKALNKLKKQDMKKAFVMKHIVGYSYEEIVDILKMPINIVKAHVFQARKLMMVEIAR